METFQKRNVTSRPRLNKEERLSLFCNLDILYPVGYLIHSGSVSCLSPSFPKVFFIVFICVENSLMALRHWRTSIEFHVKLLSLRGKSFNILYV